MRRVAAVVKNDALDRAGDPALDGIELRERPILVVASLNEQDRTAYAMQAGFDIPLPELGRKPDIVPAKKSRIDLVVIAGELLPQGDRPGVRPDTDGTVELVQFVRQSDDAPR